MKETISPYVWVGMKWKPEGKKMSLSRYFETIADSLGYTPEELMVKRRFRTLVEDRQIAMYVMRERYGAHIAAIGRLLGFDHTTVIFALRMVKNLSQNDEAIAEKVRKTMELPLTEMLHN